MVLFSHARAEAILADGPPVSPPASRCCASGAVREALAAAAAAGGGWRVPWRRRRLPLASGGRPGDPEVLESERGRARPRPSVLQLPPPTTCSSFQGRGCERDSGGCSGRPLRAGGRGGVPGPLEPPWAVGRRPPAPRGLRKTPIIVPTAGGAGLRQSSPRGRARACWSLSFGPLSTGRGRCPGSAHPGRRATPFRL